MSPHAAPDGLARERRRFELRGAVQGVGFRPFVYRLACAEGLGGFVCNTGAGAVVEVEGGPAHITRFRSRLQDELPPPAVIDELRAEDLVPQGERTFLVAASTSEAAPSARIMPDLALCGECRREILDPANRRFEYAFTTCMHCGPRYSILRSLPYDRARTAMARFEICPACRAEYDDPASRRFHAETIACAECGPRLALWNEAGEIAAVGSSALEGAVAALGRGLIVALKGVGGFQLLVDATDEEAVQRLRARKQRPRKPFALMCASLDMAEQLAQLSGCERVLLRSAAAPIVLLRRRAVERIPKSAPVHLAAGIAPSNPTLGVMLPYTPLHELLLRKARRPLVATSGNLHGEPIVTDEHEALQCLRGIADLWLVHDRPILRAADDSVVRVMAGQPVILRRARGYAPAPIAYAPAQQPVLALGGQQKNAIATAFGGSIFLSPHIGDLVSPRARAACEHMTMELPALHALTPTHVACDWHPDYYTSRLAGGLARRPAPALAEGITSSSESRVPHHLAHVLACMVDNGLSAPVLGIAWDGSGYGDDGTVWGGECLRVDEDRYRRCAHLLPFALPGGEAAIREPRRAALGVLHALYGEAALQRPDLKPILSFSAQQRRVIGGMIARQVNSPLTSSVGRLFDAVAALLDLCQRATFEGEAAMTVEAAAEQARSLTALPPMELLPRIKLLASEGCWLIDWRPLLASMIDLISANGSGGPSPEVVAALASAFHEALAHAIVEVAERVAIPRVLLTGGCFQNGRLLGSAVTRLRAAGFTPHWHRHVPPNDGGLAVGQIAFAVRPLRRDSGE